MSDLPLISVIVPVYNVEKYLRKCLDSTCGQTYPNLEILCVNDGSTDGSAAILDEYAAKDARIKVLTQKNAGLSAARNTGLEYATGEWITGVDSDDYLEPDAYEYAITGILEEVDIVCFGTHIRSLNHTHEPRLAALFEYPLTGSHKPDISGVVYTNDVFWNKLWRKSLIDHLTLRFPEGLWYEDSYFWRAAAPFARFIHFLPGKKINYVRHAASIMSQVFRKSERTMDRVCIAEKLMQFYAEHKETKIIENYETTTASTHDSNVCAELISEDAAAQTTELLADSGYFGEGVSKKVREKGVKPRIVKRRVRGQKKLTKWQERWNKAIAKRRGGIEHIFGAIKHFGGDIVRSIGLARCRIRHGLVFMLYNMKRFCFLSRTGQLCPDGTK